MRAIGVAAVVVAIVAAAAACSSSGSPKPQAAGSGNAGTAGHSSPTTSAPSSTGSSSSALPTSSSATSPTPAQPVFTAAGISGAFLKPSDLGTGWKPLDTTDKSWDTKYAWGCTDDSHPDETHQIGSLPTKRMILRSDWASYIEQYVLFPDEAAAKAAQAALENQPRAGCTGTHRVTGLDGGQATNDTTDFTSVDVAGFTGMEKHTVSLGVTNGVNESGSVEARSGSALVFVYYDLAAEQDSAPAKRHTTFTTASGAAVTKALQAIAASAR